ncbi:MAG: symporter small accessory protein [Methanobrevibacter wolinii]
MMVLGIEDPMIWGCYVLILIFLIICVVYGIINWNKGDE